MIRDSCHLISFGYLLLFNLLTLFSSSEYKAKFTKLNPFSNFGFDLKVRGQVL